MRSDPCSLLDRLPDGAVRVPDGGPLAAALPAAGGVVGVAARGVRDGQLAGHPPCAAEPLPRSSYQVHEGVTRHTLSESVTRPLRSVATEDWAARTH